MLKLVQLLNLAPGASVYQSVVLPHSNVTPLIAEWRLVANLEKVVVLRDDDGILFRLDKGKLPLENWRV